MKKAVAFLLSLLLLVLSGCTPEKNNGKTLVVASFYPVYIFTMNLLDGINDVELECMAEQNIGCLHDYRLLAKDARLLADADIFVINGAGMESFLEDVYKNTENLVVVDSSEGIELLSEEEHEEEHEEGNEEEHGHHHGANSHIWMSVDNAIKQVKNISDALCEALPENKARISVNRDMYISELQLLKADLLKESFELRNMPIITFHEAYNYLARDLSLNIVCSIESDEGGEPSAKELAELTETIKDSKIKVLYTEPDYKGSAAEILSFETGAQICVLNPVTRGEKTLTAYEDIMRENISVMRKAVRD